MGRKAENLTGKTFNYLTVIRRATEEEYPRGTGKHAVWLCKCTCGNTRFVDSSDLKNGHAISCGCKNREKAKELAYNLGKARFEDLTGQRFGKLTVIKYAGKKGTASLWECQCDCGQKTYTITNYLKTGHTTSCGCNRNWNHGKTSKGEEKIITILQNDKIKFEREKTFSDMKQHGHNLRLDFFIPDQNIAIEFNGLEHYEQVEFFQKTRYDFLKRQEYDRYKISYCLAHNIKLYIIPYWEIDNLKTAQDLFQEKYRARDRWKNDRDYAKKPKFDKQKKF